MKFFLSGIVDHEIGDAFARARTRIEPRLNSAVRRKNYGTAVDLVALIPVISNRMRGKERRLFQRAKRTADYRLAIPLEKFRRSSARAQEQLLLESALTAICDLDRKAKAARLPFDGARLVTDIRSHFKLAEQPNNTPHSDARANASVHNGRQARAGGRGR